MEVLSPLIRRPSLPQTAILGVEESKHYDYAFRPGECRRIELAKEVPKRKAIRLNAQSCPTGYRNKNVQSSSVLSVTIRKCHFGSAQESIVRRCGRDVDISLSASPKGVPGSLKEIWTGLNGRKNFEKFKAAFASSPRSKEYPKLTYVGYGRKFLRHVVFKATECDSEDLFESYTLITNNRMPGL